MADLTNLQAAVAANTQAVTDVEAEVASLKAATGTDQTTIDALTSQIAANNAALEALKPPQAGPPETTTEPPSTPPPTP